MIEEGTPIYADEERFFAAVGKAITRWADLEDVLFKITHGILGCSRERAAIVFYRTPTIDARLTLTADLIASFLPRHAPGDQPDSIMKQWKELEKDVRDRLQTRNRLAHHPAGAVVLISPTDDWSIVTGSYPSEGERLRKRQEEPQPLVIEEVRTHIQVVGRLISCLDNFQRLHLPKSPSGLGAQEFQQAPLRDLGSLLEDQRPPPPLSSQE
jgi:hypothetical protein